MRKAHWLLVILFLGGCQRSVPPAAVELTVAPAVIRCVQGEIVPLRVVVDNRAAGVIATRNRFFLSFHLAGTANLVENRRFALPRAARRGRTEMTVPVFFSAPPGRYSVRFDLVREGDFWGERRGWRSSTAELELLPLVSAEFRRQELPVFSPGEPWAEAEQHLVRLCLRNGEVRDGRGLVGFAPGSDYPQVWIRDTATLIGYALRFYPWNDLAGVLERFLAVQRPDGEMVDWFDGQGKTGKNTVATDQESSLILAAAAVARGHDEWLGRPLQGKRIIDRLAAAAEWVWTRRRDPECGLITSGLTADWGDVERSYPDDRALRRSDRSQPVCGIYVQAKYLQALDALTGLLEVRGERVAARRWRQRREGLALRTRAVLYRPDLGYFRIHRVVGRRPVPAAGEILAVGGNAEAILAGLLDRNEGRRFFAVWERKRSELGLTDPSFVLLPPFPAGYFPHPLLRTPYSYQNGGAWDWFGARLARAAFQVGLDALGWSMLRQMAGKHQQTYTVYEWEDRQGVGRGAFSYAGAAGLIGELLLDRLPGSPAVQPLQEVHAP